MNLTTIKQAAQNIFLRLNWKIYRPTFISIVILLSILPCVLFLPEMYAWENSFIENIQLVVIMAIFVVSLRAKYAKQLFNWITMIVVILFLREINCGRIFFPINKVGTPVFKQWNQILSYPYNFIPNGIYGLFMIYTVYYFFKSKAYLQLCEIMKKAKIDCWNIIFMMSGIVIGTLSEMTWDNEVLEETTETLFYVAFGVLVYLYGYNKDYKVKGIK